jgi:hypothetical protein
LAAAPGTPLPSPRLFFGKVLNRFELFENYEFNIENKSLSRKILVFNGLPGRNRGHGRAAPFSLFLFQFYQVGPFHYANFGKFLSLGE